MADKKRIAGKSEGRRKAVKYRIPKKGKDGEWYPLVRVGRTIPFGYYQDPDDKHILIPIPEELELLDQAKQYLREYSLRVVADWLSKKSGRYISHAGLKKRVSIEERRRKTASHYRIYSREAEKAANKAKVLEEERLGGQGTRTYYSSDTQSS